MEEFSYLSILLSIVFGLAIANLLVGMAALVRARASTKLYWPALAWMFLLFLNAIQSWWQMFSLRSISHWRFGAFLLVMMQPVLLFLLTAIIVPNFADAAVDLRAAFYRERKWFFGVMTAYVCVSTSKEILLYGHLEGRPSLAASLVFFALAVSAFAITNETLQKFCVLVALAADIVYIASLLLTLD